MTRPWRWGGRRRRHKKSAAPLLDAESWASSARLPPERAGPPAVLASVASHGPQMANGGKVGGLASVASHGPQMANGGKVGGLASVASHGPQMANGGVVAKNPLIPGGPCLNCGTPPATGAGGGAGGGWGGWGGGWGSKLL